MSLTLVIGSMVGLFDRNAYGAQLRTYSINQNVPICSSSFQTTCHNIGTSTHLDFYMKWLLPFRV